MNRRPFHFRSLAVAATGDSTASNMSYRPHFRGGRPQIRRSYSDKPWDPADHPEFVSGGSHANRGFRPSYNAVPPPPQYVTGPQFYGPGSGHHRPGPPQVHGPRPYMHPRQVGPALGNYQPFRPQQRPQQLRPRATKPPDYREWEYARQGVSPHFERFSVLSYNILAEYLGTDHWHNLYSHIPRYIMDWNWRKRNIVFELGLWSADILCFQEVDRFQDIETELRPRGYNGIWKMRTGDPADGCAIFWRVSRFKLLHEESIEFNKLGLRDNVAQICVFESVKEQNYKSGVSTLSTSPASSSRVVVCNIHVLFNPKRGDIKLGQSIELGIALYFLVYPTFNFMKRALLLDMSSGVQIKVGATIRTLLDKAHAVSKLWDGAPIVICGDFNCTPKSPIYNFIAEQKLDLSELARDRVSGQTSAEIRRPVMPAYSDFRPPAADNSTQDSAGGCKKVEQGDLPSDTSQLEGPSGKLFPTSPDAALSEHVVSAADGNNSKPSDASASIDITLDEKLEALSLNDVIDGATEESAEDCDSFYSELLYTGQSPFPTDSGSSSSTQQLHSNGNDILNESLKRESVFRGYFPYNTSVWTPAEIQTATGSADCKVVEHPLKLTSAYAEVESSSGLRDSSGEPFATSYHRRFLGTVDYIWHSEGLQTVKVLAPIPKDVMQQTRGFPTKKWGSDHIALVSEFVFAKETHSQNSNQ